MSNHAKTTPKDFFLWFATMATLYVSSFSFIFLIFLYIDKLYPNELNFYRDPFSSEISFAVASIIILFPLYLFFTHLVNKDIRKNPEKKGIGVRKWLVYLTLFVAGITIVIDLIVLLHTYLSGDEITIGFIFKVLTILVVIGGVFLYYFYDLKGRWEKNEKASKMIGGLVAFIVLLSVVLGFSIMGSPREQRLARFDGQRVQDLQNIQWQVVQYWQEKESLPNKLSDLEDSISGYIPPADPENSLEYEYSLTGKLSFELCAEFNLERKTGDSQIRIKDPFGESNWDHGVGRVCFERDIDPERYTPIPAKERPLIR